ncbi:MAG: uroporphyrinogen decarboxylase family protein [Candidatus Humimicrobiaceae bacterium]
MNSRDRSIKTLKKEIPDRVPLFELLIDKRVIKNINTDWDYADLAEDTLDLVLTNTPSLLYRNKWIDESKGIFVNEWGIVRQESGQSVSMPLQGPIKSKEDLKNYNPPNPDDEYRYKELNYLLSRFKGKKAVGMHLHDVFNYPYYLRGMENFLMDMATDKYMVEKLVEMSVEHNITIAKNAIKMGADFIVLGDDYGATKGPIFSPKSFEELLLPGFKTVVGEIKKAGAFVIKHCCGNINSLLDMIISAGIDAIHPLDQAAGMDIAAVQKKYINKVVVIGGIDCGELLTNKFPEDVIVETKKLLKDISSKGGHILGSSNTIHPKVKPENYLAMVNTVKKFGNYPISIN